MMALRGLALLLVLQAAGEGLVHWLGLSLPGPVVGLALLLAALTLPSIRQPVAEAADRLLAHLSLLFVPVGVGVITHFDLLSRYGVRLVVVVVLSTWIGLAAAALALQLIFRTSGQGLDP
jgi:holin-like protein